MAPAHEARPRKGKGGVNYPADAAGPATCVLWALRCVPSAMATRTMPLRRRVLGGALAWPLMAWASDQPVVHTLRLPDAELELLFEPAFSASTRGALTACVRRAAEVVSGYLGRFPMPALELQFEAAAGRGVLSGTTFAEPAPWIRLRAGRNSTPQSLADDWVVVHEMLHLALPQLPRGQRWLHEGMATYGEAVARCRAGQFDATRLWRGWRLGMPQGLPGAGAAGLDHTPTWASTYWGGALWCLLADVALLQASGGRQGWRQAMQALLAAGADYRVVWDAARIVRTADQALGLRVLEPLYEQHRAQVVKVDLPALWRALGVASDTLDNAAPWAALRQAITA